MLKITLIIISILVVIFFIAVIYSACVVSGKCNKTMEGYQSDILLDKNKGNNELTDLENATLERLLGLYEEDGINFIINNGRVVDYEIE